MGMTMLMAWPWAMAMGHGHAVANFQLRALDLVYFHLPVMTSGQRQRYSDIHVCYNLYLCHIRNDISLP